MLNERGHVYMSEQEEGIQGRLVIGRKRDGRRKYDEAAKRELIQACLQPGVSTARPDWHGVRDQPELGSNVDYTASTRTRSGRHVRAGKRSVA
jgi:hypothetical protein